MTLGNRLRRERKARRLSQEELSKLCGVGCNAQSHYEMDSRTPRADYLQCLDRQGFDVYFILTGNSLPLDLVSMTPSECEILRIIRALDPKHRNAIELILTKMEVNGS